MLDIKINGEPLAGADSLGKFSIILNRKSFYSVDSGSESAYDESIIFILARASALSHLLEIIETECE
jgi:hypothetical protein